MARLTCEGVAVGSLCRGAEVPVAILASRTWAAALRAASAWAWRCWSRRSSAMVSIRMMKLATSSIVDTVVRFLMEPVRARSRAVVRRASPAGVGRGMRP